MWTYLITIVPKHRKSKLNNTTKFIIFKLILSLHLSLYTFYLNNSWSLFKHTRILSCDVQFLHFYYLNVSTGILTVPQLLNVVYYLTKYAFTNTMQS